MTWERLFDERGARADVSGRMREHLFSGKQRSPGPERVAYFARELVAESALGCVQAWVVGSFVSRPDRARDLDLLLTPRADVGLRVRDVERALVAARWIGVRRARLRVDVCFRSTAGDALAGALAPRQRVVSWKLEDPALRLALESGLLRSIRRVGLFSVVFAKRAADANFYRKLPPIDADSSAARYLIPGLPIERYVGS